MEPLPLLGVYSLAIVVASLAGGWTAARFRLTHTGLQATMSFVGGLMLGIALLHLIPHGIHHAQNVDLVALWTLIGLLVMFFLVRTFHFHQHDLPDWREPEQMSAEPVHPVQQHEHGSAESCGHSHGPHELSWLGVTLGLGLHTLIDGVAVGSAVVSQHAHTSGSGWYGAGVFLAVLLHKPLDAMSVTALMLSRGWSLRAAHGVNLLIALMCPLGALLVALGMDWSNLPQATLFGAALGFSAGVFLCISLSDLLPELQFHAHDRIPLSLALLGGVGAAILIGALEPAHLHP